MTAHFNIDVAGSIAQSDAAGVTLLAPVARLSLRAGGADLEALSGALGVALPVRIGQRASDGGIEALCLGPDEWLLQMPEADVAGVTARCSEVYGHAPHSLVEITDREITVQIDGPKASELLTFGLPRDIDSLAVGTARRTYFDGVTVVIWRDGDQSFRMDIWRSFAPHVLSLLETGCRELADT